MYIIAGMYGGLDIVHIDGLSMYGDLDAVHNDWLSKENDTWHA